MYRLLAGVLLAFLFLATVRLIWTKWLKNFLIKEEIIQDGSTNESDKQSTTGE